MLFGDYAFVRWFCKVTTRKTLGENWSNYNILQYCCQIFTWAQPRLKTPIQLFANKLKYLVWVIDYQYGIPSVQEMIHIGDYLLAFHKTWQNDMHPIFVIIIRQVHHMSSWHTCTLCGIVLTMHFMQNRVHKGDYQMPCKTTWKNNIHVIFVAII